MKKQKQYRTNYFLDKHDIVNINKKINNLLEDSIPNTILVMLGQGVETKTGVKFYNRYTLIPLAKNNYTVYDESNKSSVFDHIALFDSAVKIIYYLNQHVSTPCPTYKVIYDLDQEYFRCLEDIKFYKERMDKSKNNQELYSIKLLDKHQKLNYIKQRLSKVY